MPRTREHASEEERLQLQALALERHIGSFTPPSWEEPISKATSVPEISVGDFQAFTELSKTDSLDSGLDTYRDGRCARFYLKSAILDYFEKSK